MLSPAEGKKWVAQDYRQISALLGRKGDDISEQRYEALKDMAEFSTEKNNGYSLFMQNMADMWLYILEDKKRGRYLKTVLQQTDCRDIFELIAAIADMQIEVARIDE